MNCQNTNSEDMDLRENRRFPVDSRVHVESTGSTNADVMGWISANERLGAVLVTDYQGAGRGRLDRTWEAKPGDGLLVSFLIEEADVSGLLPLVLGVAALEVVRSRGGNGVRLKWPNDVMVGPRKLAGILVEAAHRDGAIVAAVAGIGMNVHAAPAEAIFLDELLSQSGQTDDENVTTDRAELLDDLCSAFDDWLDVLATGEPGRRRLLDTYRSGCVTIGQQVRVDKLDKTSFTGHATDIDDDGLLLVSTNGEVVAVQAGDVHHLRPTP